MTRAGDRLELDFPSQPAAAAPRRRTFWSGAWAAPRSLSAGPATRWLCVFARAAEVRDPAARSSPASPGVQPGRVIVTAPGDDCDFVSRFFAPDAGIAEDPVTGSAHCTLTPYWAARLGRPRLHARQVSARGGELWCELRGDRVGIAGRAVTYLRGEIEV